MAKEYILKFEDDTDAADFEAGCELAGFTPETLMRKDATDMILAKRRDDIEKAKAQAVAPDAASITLTDKTDVKA